MPDREWMVRRQRVLAGFGDFALRSEDLTAILTEACRLVSEALGTDLAKVVEIDHEKHELLVRAGVGWKPGVVGQTRMPLAERSSETYSVKAGTPVVTPNISEEGRFVFSSFLKEHGVAALVNVPVFLPGGRAYGLLQVDSLHPREFAEEDIEFLRTYATILGPVIDRLHMVHDLRVALDANRRLLEEIQHRIKNHIGVIVGLVRVRTKAAGSEEARRELAAVGERIEALRLVHEQLYVAGTTDRLPLRPFLVRLIEGLFHLHEGQSGNVRLDFALGDFELSPDAAVPLGLLVNEFVTNSLKYAFDGQGGAIEVCVEPVEEGRVRVRLSDNGKGLPAGPRRPSSPGSGTGMRIIEGLARQIGAEPRWSSSEQGTTLHLEFARR